MPYKDSYLSNLRQKIGHDLVLTPTVDVIAVRPDGKVLLCYSKEYDAWTTPGGSVEIGKTWRESALNELLEEGGLSAKAENLLPFAASSGQNWSHQYQNGDKVQSFSLAFIVKNWIDQSDPIDTEEIAEKQFFSLDEIKTLKLSKFAKVIIEAFIKYQETNDFQVIDIN